MQASSSVSGFEALGLSSPLLKALNRLGYETPSPIQQESIPALLEGNDLIGQAQTGTGKTAAFALPLLMKINTGSSQPQALVLTPTRELAIQVAEALQNYSRELDRVHVLPVYGGQDMRTQLRALKRGVQIIVGTPGRIQDHLNRKSLDLSKVSMVVLDEADEMLRMGFIDDVENILSFMPEKRQTALFSATMPAPIRRIADNYLNEPKEIRIQSKTSTVESIEQYFYSVPHREKLDILTRIMDAEQFDAVIIFTRTRESSLTLAEKLAARGFSCAAINGDLSQAHREKTINQLKKRQIDVLIATDVAARGLDVDRITHVINYDIPYDSEAYVHRIGRTGRAGRTGKALLLITPRENRLLHSIEKATGQKITHYRLPTQQQVAQLRREKLYETIREKMERNLPQTYHELADELLNRSELPAQQLVTILLSIIEPDAAVWDISKPEFDPASKKPKAKQREQRRDADEKDDSTNDDDRPARSPSRRSMSHESPVRPLKGHPDIEMEQYRIEVGRTHEVQVGDIVGAIANEAGMDREYIGHIQLFDEYSLVDLPDGMPGELLTHLKKVRVRQQPMQMRLNSAKVAGGEDKKPGPRRSPKPKTQKAPAEKKRRKDNKAKPAKNKKPAGKRKNP